MENADQTSICLVTTTVEGKKGKGEKEYGYSYTGYMYNVYAHAVQNVLTVYHSM